MKRYITPTITIIKIKNVDILTESILVDGKGPSKSPFRSGNDDSDGYDY